MSQDQDHPGVQRIQESLTRAYEAKSQYDLAVQLDAAGHDVSVDQQRIRFQQFVLHTLSLLRPYLVTELREKYWEGATVYAGSDGEIVGLKNLMYYQGATKESGGWVDTDHGQEYQTSREPALLPPMALRHALDLLAEATFLLGFSPSPKKRRGKFNASVFDDDERASQVVKKSEQ